MSVVIALWLERKCKNILKTSFRFLKPAVWFSTEVTHGTEWMSALRAGPLLFHCWVAPPHKHECQLAFMSELPGFVDCNFRVQELGKVQDPEFGKNQWLRPGTINWLHGICDEECFSFCVNRVLYISYTSKIYDKLVYVMYIQGLAEIMPFLLQNPLLQNHKHATL